MLIYGKLKYLNKRTKKLFKLILLFFTEYIPGDDFTISDYYGRLGNNLQQIANGIAFSEKYNQNFYSKPHQYIKSISSIRSDSKSFVMKKYRFFNYKNVNKINKDCPKNKYISYEDALSKTHNIFQTKLLQNIKFYKQIPIPTNKLVIHIRSGDIFEKTKHFDQVQNPLAFYLEVIKNYKDILIVTEKSKNNPVIQELLNLKEHKVEIQSGTIEEDFNTLINALNLCLSGVGTFGIAAAMLSINLKKIYFSNLYLKSHLNPEMINKKSIEKNGYKIHNYLKVGEWSNSEHDRDLMLKKDLKVEKIL